MGIKLTTYTTSCNKIAIQCIASGTNRKHSFIYARQVRHANIKHKRMIRIKNIIIK